MPVYDPVYRNGLWEVTFRGCTKRYRAVSAEEAKVKILAFHGIHQKNFKKLIPQGKPGGYQDYFNEVTCQIVEHTIRLSHI